MVFPFFMASLAIIRKADRAEISAGRDLGGEGGQKSMGISLAFSIQKS